MSLYIILNAAATTQHNSWPNEKRDVEKVCLTDIEFKRNLTQLSGSYD